MARSGVSLNWGGMDRALMGAMERMSDRSLLMDGIGEMLVSGTIQRFEDEEGPDGKKWKPSARARRDGDKTLTDSARLRNSLDYRAGSDEVTVGSNVTYARIHQMGGKAGRGLSVNLPARPYLGVGKQDAEDIKEAVGSFIADAFTGGGR